MCRVGGPGEGVDACTVVSPARCDQFSFFRVEQDDFPGGLINEKKNVMKENCMNEGEALTSPEARYFPSGEKARDDTTPWLPSRTAISFRALPSHSWRRTFRS